uniref:group II intron maturase-specific domain-containing protein n=1 Tax=Turicimonas muris TaxID=1796652 RepID=UPI00402AB6BF
MGSLHSARGTSLKTTIERITPVLRGWRNYYRLDTRKQYWSEMDERIVRFP